MKNQSILSIASVITKTASKIGIAGLLTSAAMLSQASNAADNAATTIPLDLSGINITKHEIAVMQVLSEICPSMLNGNQKQRFYKSYTVQLHELMPSLDDPKAAIWRLSIVCLPALKSFARIGTDNTISAFSIITHTCQTTL